MIQVADRAPSIPCIGEAQFARIQALRWDNPHSTRLQAVTGCKELVTAFDPSRSCWLLATRIPVFVRHPLPNGKWDKTLERGVLVWDTWTDNGQALSIDDPRLEDYVRRCDRSTQRTKWSDEVAADAAAREAAADREIEALARSEDLRRAFAKLADRRGMSGGHRKLSSEGGRISTALISRRGAGAPQ